MQHSRALVPSQNVYVIAALLAVAVVVLTMWPKAKAATTFDARCESWDNEAGAVIASLIADRSEFAEARASDALFRLRRARKYCRIGFDGMARRDYDALLGNRYELRR